MFIENKGQITDPNGQPRSDIQFKLESPPNIDWVIYTSLAANGTESMEYDFVSLIYTPKIFLRIKD